jgi:VWFA-related protein
MTQGTISLRRMAGGLLLAAMCLAPAAAVSAQSEDTLNIQITQVDTSQFPVVKVYVSVTDAAGEPVAVDVGSLILSEDGRDLPATEAAGVGDSEPLTTMLVIDTSGSMKYAGKMTSAISAAQAYVDQMQSWEQAGLIDFNTVITYTHALTADRAALRSAIGSLTASENDTAMYDGLAKAEEILQGISGRKAVIVLTDGMDNRSKTTADSVVEGIGPAGLSISTIALGEPAQGKTALEGVDEATLQDLAAKAGGTFGYADDQAALTALYEQLGRTLHSEYVLTYTSPASLRDGVNRALSVRLDLSVAAQSGAASYNPGGVVPEVESASTGPVFLILLAALAFLLSAPALGQWTLSAVKTAKGGSAKASKPSASRIRLKEAPSRPRIKLH